MNADKFKLWVSESALSAKSAVQVLVFGIAGFLVAFSARASVSPNVVVILADDLGYGDLGCYGSTTIATPRIDHMAREGVRFTDAYSAAPFCSPSRAALLTGRLPARCGVPYVLFPAEHHGLPEKEITLAELLKRHGYATACIGKWHLGWDAPFRPQRHGFDEFFGLPYSNDSTEWAVGAAFTQVMGLEPLPLIDRDAIIEAPVDQARLTQRYPQRAVEFMRGNRERPFFLYLAHTMPDVPQYASGKFTGKSKGGLYGDAVEELDWSTGVILDALRELGLAERTLVLFTSDNGAPARPRANAAVKAKAGPAAERFPGRNHAGNNGPLRGGKGTTFEGGVRVPLLAWQPGTISAGRESAAPISHLDLFPTATRLAGVTLPSDRVFDGRDLGAELKSDGRPGVTRLLFHYFGYQLQAVREGNWKLLVAVPTRPQPPPMSLWFEHHPRVFENQHRLLAEPELYDLSRDVAEAQNVAAQNPAIVARLTQLARDFDAPLQRDRRPLQIVPGPRPPPPRAIRTPETDLSKWRTAARAIKLAP